MALWSTKGCQWVGPEQDPLTGYPMSYCGKPNVGGKNYCHEHYFRVYAKETSVNGKRISRQIEKEIQELQQQQEINEMEDMIND